MKISASLILFFILINVNSWAKGLFYLNGGLTNKKHNTKKYGYGPGFTYPLREDLELTGVGLKHKKKSWQLAYGLENSDSNRNGIKYPLFLKATYLKNNFIFEFVNRYFPEFYSNQPIHFLSFSPQVKYDLWHTGFEISRLYHLDKTIFGHFFLALEKTFQQKYFLRLEYVRMFNQKKVPHMYDWLTTTTIGFFF